MDRNGQAQERVMDDSITAPARQMFQRMLTGWAHDCLAKSMKINWKEPDPIEDYSNHDWSLLYKGDLLDDWNRHG